MIESQDSAVGLLFMRKKMVIHPLGVILVVYLLMSAISGWATGHPVGGSSQQPYRWEIVATRAELDRADHWMSPKVSVQTAFLGLDIISTPGALKFPADALAQGIHHGRVILRLLIDEKGEVVSVIVDRATSPLFVDVAVVAAKQYRFKPTVIDGLPVRRVAVLPFGFDTH